MHRKSVANVVPGAHALNDSAMPTYGMPDWAALMAAVRPGKNFLAAKQIAYTADTLEKYMKRAGSHGAPPARAI